MNATAIAAAFMYIIGWILLSYSYNRDTGYTPKTDIFAWGLDQAVGLYNPIRSLASNRHWLRDIIGLCHDTYCEMWKSKNSVQCTLRMSIMLSIYFSKLINLVGLSKLLQYNEWYWRAIIAVWCCFTLNLSAINKLCSPYMQLLGLYWLTYIC